MKLLFRCRRLSVVHWFPSSQTCSLTSRSKFHLITHVADIFDQNMDAQPLCKISQEINPENGNGWSFLSWWIAIRLCISHLLQQPHKQQLRNGWPRGHILYLKTNKLVTNVWKSGYLYRDHNYEDWCSEYGVWERNRLSLWSKSTRNHGKSISQKSSMFGISGLKVLPQLIWQFFQNNGGSYFTIFRNLVHF